jgi:hypothetical protein
MKYIYKVLLNNTHTVISTLVQPVNIHYFYGPTNCNTGKENRRASSNGNAVTKIWKKLA